MKTVRSEENGDWHECVNITRNVSDTFHTLLSIVGLKLVGNYKFW